MIKKKEVAKIGQFNRPHGIKGELSFTFSNDVFDGSECEFLICEMAGILVPFRVESYRIRSDVSALVKLKGINSEEAARKLIHADVYFPAEYLSESASSEENATWDYFIGFTLKDSVRGEIGKIIEIEKSTINILLIVVSGDDEIFIPAVEEWIAGVDAERKLLEVDLPEGLLSTPDRPA
jgi:16S rRNA processing protein RimM